MTSVSDLRAREAKIRPKKPLSNLYIFFFCFCVFIFQLDCPIWIHTFQKNFNKKERIGERSRPKKESKARGPAKREQQATTIPASVSSGDQPFQPVKKGRIPTSMSRKYKRNIKTITKSIVPAWTIGDDPIKHSQIMQRGVGVPNRLRVRSPTSSR